jgi:holo-[acyl-carrier protein] synthase
MPQTRGGVNRLQLIGVGLDLIELPRFAKLYGGDDPDVLERVFTRDELAYAGVGQDRAARLAGRFAAKEAVLKVIGGLSDGVALTDIEIRAMSDGAPRVELQGGARVEALARHIDTWLVSITHTDGSAAAVAIGVSAGPR